MDLKCRRLTGQISKPPDPEPRLPGKGDEFLTTCMDYLCEAGQAVLPQQGEEAGVRAQGASAP